jgi:tetratricopeptide (TPR) repeat protein
MASPEPVPGSGDPGSPWGIGAKEGGHKGIHPELGTLEAHGLISIAATRPEIRYAFRHALVQESAYRGLLRRERQALHRRVADVLEDEHAERREEVAALLAHHLDLAGETDRAIPYLLEAGRQALARYANREAESLFERVRALLEGRTDEESVRRRLEATVGEVEAGITFVPGNDQLAMLEEVLPEAEELGDERLLAQVHLGIGVIRESIGESFVTSPQMRNSIERARELGEKLGDETLVALPLGVIGSAKHAEGRFREAIADGSKAVEILERREQFSHASIFAGGVAMSYGTLGEFTAAEEWLERSRILADKSCDPNALLDADLAYGFVESERGNLRDALEHTQRAIDQAKEVGNNACALFGSFMLGDAHLRLGEAEAAIPALEQSGDLAQYCNVGSVAALSAGWLAAARARIGGADGVEGLTASLKAARAHGDPLGEAQIHHLRASVLASVEEPDWDAVFEDFDAAVGGFEQLGARPHLARALHDYGVALDRAGRQAEAESVLGRASDLFDTMAIAQSP